MKLNVLMVSGFRIHIDDGSDFWKLADSVADLSNVTVTDRTWDSDDPSGLQDSDLAGRDVILCYSWGVASVFKAFDRLTKAGTMPDRIPLLVIMAGVPRGIGQCLEVALGGGWKVPAAVTEAVCLQVDSFPVSYPIANSEPERVNILITGIPGNDHVGIQDFQSAHDIILNLIASAACACAQKAAA